MNKDLYFMALLLHNIFIILVSSGQWKMIDPKLELIYCAHYF